MNSIIFIVLLLFVFPEGKTDTGKLKICLLGNKNLASTEANNSSEEVLRGIVDSISDAVIPDGQLNFTLNNDVIRADGYVQNVSLESILDITICFHKIIGIKILKNITFNNITMKADQYSLNGTVADMFYIFGKGPLNINIRGFTIEIENIGLALPFGCFTMDINAKLREWTVDFVNLMDGDEILEPTINAIIGDMGPDIIDYIWPLIYSTLAPEIQTILNDDFNKVNLGHTEDTFLKEEGQLNELLSDTCTTYN